MQYKNMRTFCGLKSCNLPEIKELYIQLRKFTLERLEISKCRLSCIIEYGENILEKIIKIFFHINFLLKCLFLKRLLFFFILYHFFPE